MKRKYNLILLILLLGQVSAGAMEKDQIYSLEDLVYKVESMGFPDELLIAGNSLEPTNISLKVYFQYLIGLGYYYRDKEELALSELEKGLVIAKKSSESNEDLTGFVLMTESLIMQLKGLGYIMKKAPQLEKEFDRYLEIYPSNPIGIFLKAQSLLNKPKLFGGNPKEAVKLIQSVQYAFPESPSWNFQVNLALAMGFDKIKNPEEALHYQKLAKAYFPQHPLLQ